MILQAVEETHMTALNRFVMSLHVQMYNYIGTINTNMVNNLRGYEIQNLRRNFFG